MTWWSTRHGRVIAVDVIAESDGGFDAALAALHPDERRRAVDLAPARRGEWIAGRRALRAALIEVGGAAVGGGALGVDERGAPQVPAGLVGSISHKRDRAVAIAAVDDGWRIGVDLEQLGPRRLDLSPRVLTTAEQAAIVALAGRDRDDAVIRAFALKEAVYKAIDPFLRRHVGFREVAVWPSADGSATVDAAPDWGLIVEAGWWRDGDAVVCTARARRG